MEEMVAVIDSVVNRLPMDKQKVIQLRYWKRPQLLTWEGIAQEAHISRRQAFNIRDEIIWAMANMLGMR
jgi:RinA family phage transcriptional activator